jgi:hypothetical protein
MYANGTKLIGGPRVENPCLGELERMRKATVVTCVKMLLQDFSRLQAVCCVKP